ncbi:hypothetical protein GMRT_10961 [Giardia muris]|uniref:Uncharacterized protein n=1 Tax=Giardia muris TaxID=5742 RepID=A0A4Z1SU21_GIAMU|nr:hypothetical protein GMRT_10961 [Giardia muris]|eukprot:TNJ29354.1 hypothetical protein GMRT_10961 [Giardia muris]
MMNSIQAHRILRDTEVAAFYLMVRAFKMDPTDFLTKMALVTPVARALRISDEQAVSILHALHDNQEVLHVRNAVAESGDAVTVQDPTPDTFATLLMSGITELAESRQGADDMGNSLTTKSGVIEIPGWQPMELRTFEKITGVRDNAMARFLSLLTARKFGTGRRRVEYTASKLRELRRDLLRELRAYLNAHRVRE